MARIAPVEVKPGEWVEVKPGESVRLFGITERYLRASSVIPKGCYPVEGRPHLYLTPYERTFLIGDIAEFDSFNLSYTGRITGIGAKTVTLQDKAGGRTRRLRLATFHMRNWNFDLAETQRSNSEMMMSL